jgi:endonuclease/exonuclease/phosphatase family metal-dependent hydrolase
MQSLAEGLRLLKPDIIACQECFVSEEADNLKFLAAELHMNYLLANGREKKRYFEGKWVDSLSGLGILSTYPIREFDTFILPASAEDNDRKAQQAIICLPSGEELLLTNVHLTHLRDNVLREAQAKFVAKRVTSVGGAYIKIVCGDFNAELGSDEINAFMSTGDAIDAYETGEGIEPRCTLIEACELGKNISVDHIFALPFPGGGYPQFINSKVVLNKPGSNGVFPSDHFGICTTLITDQT